MMSKMLRAIGSAIGITIIVSLVLSLCLWFFGGLIGFGESRPFETIIGRVVALAVLWILALVMILIFLMRDKKRDESLAEEIVQSAAAPVSQEDEVVTAELGEMRGKLKTAMGQLRKSKFGRNSLYKLPWYIMIGPPGAGKTTAIVNSGLQFPLAEEMGKTAIGGVGGTRNCDWWFTDNAVLVDTAGRYTTQESDADADNAAWMGFLRLLKKHRKRQPINGAIIAISLSDLSLQDAATQQGHATAIRRRLHELREQLGVHFPVYILFTKADLIAGFTEFFDNLGREERGQVWGFTLPLLKRGEKSNAMESFDGEFSVLLSQINSQSLNRIQDETDHERRSLIAGFPGQVASVRQIARDFLETLFQTNKYEHQQMLRGVYFTSGTQEGTPIDRLMMGMARTFGIGRQAIGTGQGSGRSFFLTRLFNQVIFREAGLVSADDKVERRYKWALRGAVLATVLAAVGAGTVWVRSYLGNQDLLARTETQIAAYQEAAAVIPNSPIGDTDLPGVVPALNILRDMPSRPTEAQSPTPNGLGWGLFQGKLLKNEEVFTYRSALNQHYLPRLLLRLEDQMQGNINDADFLYEALKIYLMLGQAGPLSPELIEEWMTKDWAVTYPGAAREGFRADLEGHLKTLISQPMTTIDLNADLVSQVQDVLTELPQAQRVYNGIINAPAAKALPEWRLTDYGGPAVNRAFVRSSGKPLNDGIDGIYTYAGFNTVFLGEALAVTERLQSEAWVLGDQAQAGLNQDRLVAISRDVLGLYYNDYIAQWEALLADLNVIPLEDMARAIEVTKVLSGETSPIVNVLEAVGTQTRLTLDPNEGGVDAGAAAGALVSGSSSPIRRKLGLKSRILLEAMMAAAPSSGASTAPPKPGAPVDARFAWLHKMVDQVDGQPSQLDGLIGSLVTVAKELDNIAFSGSGATQASSKALRDFQSTTANLEGPIKRWASQISVGSSGVAADGTRSAINAAWQAEVLPTCSNLTGNVYPFNRSARQDLSMQDFGTLFAPGGKLDAFFNTHLVKHVDTSGRKWAWKRGAGPDLGISPAVLTQMQYAAEIRAAFFPAGPVPSVKFQLTPGGLDPKATGIQWEIHGQTIAVDNKSNTVRPMAFTWPGTIGLSQVAMAPAKAGSENGISKDGPWALFRILDAAQLRKTNLADRKKIIFKIGGRLALFHLQTGSAINPFDLPALRKFKCPKTF